MKSITLHTKRPLQWGTRILSLAALLTFALTVQLEVTAGPGKNGKGKNGKGGVGNFPTEYFELEISGNSAGLFNSHIANTIRIARIDNPNRRVIINRNDPKACALNVTIDMWALLPEDAACFPGGDCIDSGCDDPAGSTDPGVEGGTMLIEPDPNSPDPDNLAYNKVVISFKGANNIGYRLEIEAEGDPFSQGLELVGEWTLDGGKRKQACSGTGAFIEGDVIILLVPTSNPCS